MYPSLVVQHSFCRVRKASVLAHISAITKIPVTLLKEQKKSKMNTRYLISFIHGL